MWELDDKEGWAPKNWFFWTVVLEKTLESSLDCKEIQPVWSWNANALATWYEVLTHWKRPWCWERLKARGEGDDRGWHHQLNGHEFEQAPGVSDGQERLPCCLLQSMGSQRVGHNWATELSWIKIYCMYSRKQCTGLWNYHPGFRLCI